MAAGEFSGLLSRPAGRGAHPRWAAPSVGGLRGRPGEVKVPKTPQRPRPTAGRPLKRSENYPSRKSIRGGRSRRRRPRAPHATARHSTAREPAQNAATGRSVGGRAQGGTYIFVDTYVCMYLFHLDSLVSLLKETLPNLIFLALRGERMRAFGAGQGVFCTPRAGPGGNSDVFLVYSCRRRAKRAAPPPLKLRII